MPTFQRTVLAALAFVIAACSSFEVSSDYDPDVDFSSGFERYALVPVAELTDSGVADELTHKLLREALNAELAARGFVATESAPDFLVGYHAAIETKLSYRPSTSTGFVVGSHGRVSTVVGVNSMNEPYTYDEGTLIVDFLRGPAKQLVWRGTASSTVHKHASRDDRLASAREAIAKMLAQFPPQR